MKTFILTLGIFLIMVSWSVSDACNKAGPLFKIERSKNGNVVQYDACLREDGLLAESDPVSAYWILEDGRREDLNMLEKKTAYGLKLEKRLEKDKVQISLAAFEDRKLIVERKDGKYRVVTSINGKESVLEKLFVKSEEHAVGPSRVLYVDLFGRSLADNTPVQEHFVPRN